jgi:pyrimidine-nucleoside phosphorylase
MREHDQAVELARTMVGIGSRMGRGMTAVLTDMNQPLGCTAGNALEVRESIDALRGGGPADLRAVTLELGAHMLLLTGLATELDTARATLATKLDDGAALEVFRRMVEHQGGDVLVVDDPARLAQAPVVRAVRSEAGGFVAEVRADAVGRAVLLLGAGRRRTDERIDPAVGVADLLRIGAPVSSGDPLVTIHARKEADADEAEALLKDAFVLSESAVPAPSLLGAVITPEDP